MAQNTTPEFVHINPAELRTTANIRTDLQLHPDFLSSVADLGVLTPIVARREDDGTLTVLFGHRRTAAALAAKLDTVPVRILDIDTTDEKAADIDRIVSQWAENEHRTALSKRERVAVVDQLALYGISDAQIAKRIKAPRAEVTAARTIAASTAAAGALDQLPQLTIEQAAVFAEFEDDEDTTAALLAAAQRGSFDHQAQFQRDRVAREARRRAAAAALEAEGATVIDRPDYQARTVELHRLGENGEGIAPEDHADCPGHCAWLESNYVTIHKTTGAEIDPDDETEYDEDDLEDREVYHPVWCCADPHKHGHAMRPWIAKRFTSGAPDTDTDDPEAAAEAAKEVARQARREVKANNDQWRSAETVRRDWLRDYLTRKTPPKGAADFIATALATDPHLITQLYARDTAADLLIKNRTAPAHVALADAAAAASDSRAQVIVLGQILAAYETATSVESWRTLTKENARYLAYLASIGYTLSDIEKRAAAIPTDQD
ncbi:ParB N-terminal domain-containing protein [Rhodococcus hoagii]|nr:ParB N-terminal domain-containing protein [Prescottella equi]